MIKLVTATILVMLFCPSLAFAQSQIFTTFRDDGNQTIWDGKWSYLEEWKHTTDTTLVYGDGNSLSIRIGHDFHFLYILLDFVNQHVFNKNSDYGLVCIVANQTLESHPQADDYCFLSPLGSYNSLTFQGGSNLAETGYFVKVPNDPNLIAVGGISDINDRYSPTPHTSYEFRIPINAVGRSDTYGFYVSVYDSHNGMSYSWPQNVTRSSFPIVPSPSEWGQLISPDKTLPEFPYPAITLLASMLTIISLARRLVFN
jgi:hypothetical protein